MAFNLTSISSDSTSRAPKGIIYGPPGIGKTTFGAIQNGLIVDCENGLPLGLVAAHTPHMATWKQIKECLDWLSSYDHGFHSVTIDTIDWLLRRMEEHVSGTDGSEKGMASTLNKSQGGFGNGKQVLRNYAYQYLLPTLDKIVNKGTAVILLAHTARRTITTMEGAEVDRSAPAIHPDISDVIIEWSDFVGAAHMIGNVRSLTMQENYQMIAKNRYGIAATLPLSWQSFVSSISG